MEFLAVITLWQPLKEAVSVLEATDTADCRLLPSADVRLLLTEVCRLVFGRLAVRVNAWSLHLFDAVEDCCIIIYLLIGNVIEEFRNY